MQLNDLRPAVGAKTKKVRVGRGIGSGIGKTCGKGHKGQKSRAGGYHKVGFEGGQMPIQRRLPKFGFSSRTARFHESLPLSVLTKLVTTEVSVEILKNAGLIGKHILTVKFYGSCTLEKNYALKDVRATKSAKEAVIQSGGTCE